jgi:Lar family restriction alleviation protein
MTKRGEEVELLPCPFCGASPHVLLSFDSPGVSVGCPAKRCGIRGPHRANEVSAFKAWNTRPERKEE